MEGDKLLSDDTLINLGKPANYSEAMVATEVAKWIGAMDNENKSM